jgi:DNA invertase Pin-like site-specific DNA recombinase
MAERKAVRCVIYTRKSTEYGLEQDFNSLDAQREACEAYIKSQSHEGWRLLPTHYDDGGISGATLDRPAIQALLADIKARKVDVIVVYKVDRLTRSLADFAKLVEIFDAHGVSFVSVTQQFNTTTSMGRLTLNVLLSFAQFEREVTAERIRDKIAASKQKGMWMGGPTPLGYVIQDRKLVPDKSEAEQVRYIFRRYLELGSIRELKKDLDDKGIVTKVRKRREGKSSGGIPFAYGPLAYLLKNRLYIGETAHGGKSYPGQHDAILEQSQFDAVQAKMAENAVTLKNNRTASGSILIGHIFDDAGNRMTPVHAQRGAIRYRYYVSAPVNEGSVGGKGSLSRVAAPEVEALVMDAVREHAGATPGDIDAAAVLDQDLIDAHVKRIIVSRDSVAITFKGDEGEDSGTVIKPLVRINRVPRREIVPGSAEASDPQRGMRSENHRRLVTMIAKARRWTADLVSGAVADTASLAAREDCSERHIRMVLPLAFLAPDIVTAALANRLPPRISISKIWSDLPLDWSDQRTLFGVC